MQQCGRESDQKAYGLFKFRSAGNLEIFLESHLARQKIEQRRTDAQWRDGDRRDGMLGAICEDLFACGECKEIETVDVNIHIAEEVFEIVGADTIRKNPDIDFRVDLKRHPGKRFNLGMTDAAYPGTNLPIEILDFKDIKIGDIESSNPQTGQGQQVNATDTAHAGNRNSLVAQDGLFLSGHPTNIPRKGFVVIECVHDGSLDLGLSYDNNLGIDLAYKSGRMISLTIDFRLATRNLRRNTQRSLVATLTVAFGIVAFLLAGGFIAWIFEQMREDTIHSQLGHLQIVRPDYFDKGIADPYAFLLPATSPEQKVVETMPGFRSLAPRLSFSGLISHGDTTIAFVGDGVDPVNEKPISSRVTIVSGRDLLAAQENYVLLGEGLARSLGVKEGDAVVLLASAANGSASAVEVRVAGTFATITKEYDDSALRLPIQVARKLMKVKGATSWVVLLDETGRTAESASYLKTVLSDKDFEVVPWNTLADFYNKTVVLFSRQVSVVKFIIGIIIVLTISNTQMMGVLERTTEIGTSLAIGQRRRTIMRMFIAEGALIGLLGGLLGVVLGFVLAQLISSIGIPMPPPPGMARGFLGEILIEPSLALEALVLALVTTFVASVMPAWKASRMNIVDALRYNQ